MNYLKNSLGWVVISAIVVIPAIIWSTMWPWSMRFGSTSAVFTSLGQLAGLTGMALFAVNLILSARLRFFDRYFRGLNRVYVHHHRLGAIAFVLLLFHPLLLTMRYLVFSLAGAAVFLLSVDNWAINFGKLSLIGMVVLLVLTFFISLRYDIWKNTHKFLGLAFFLGGLHVFFIASDVSRNGVLRGYMLALTALGLLAYAYHTLLNKIAVKRYLYKVDEVNRLNEVVTEIILSPIKPAEKINYTAGQFAFINFNDKQVSVEQHPFSFVSDPSADRIKFAVKNLGDYTGNLSKLSPGAMAKIDGPYGQFSFSNFPNYNQIWVAGGIGITPFVSMSLALFARSDAGRYAVDLYYCVKNAGELVLLNQFEALAKQHSNFHLIPFCSDQRGLINVKTISETSGGLSGKDFLLCGPPPLMSALREQLVGLGIKKYNIHSEEFKF